MLFRSHWKVRDLIEVSPSRLLLSSGKAGDTRSGKLIVTGPSDEELVLEEVKFNGAFGQADSTWERLGPNRALISVTVTVPSEPGLHTAELEIRCTRPIEKTIVVPVSVYVFTQVAEQANENRTES